jgi:hypothetical protein
VIPRERSQREGAVSATALWIVLKILESLSGLGQLQFYPWALVVLSPAIASATIAQWTCRRAGTGSPTTLGFSIGAALMTVLFAVVAATWLLNGGN